MNIPSMKTSEWRNRLIETYGDSENLNILCHEIECTWVLDANKYCKEYCEYLFYNRTDFVYDYKSQLIFVDVYNHIELLSALWRCGGNTENELNFKEADDYIDYGHGCFKSSVSQCIYYDGKEIPNGFKTVSEKFEKL